MGDRSGQYQHERPRSRVLLAMLIMCAVTSVMCGVVLLTSGSFRDLEEHPLECQRIADVPGVEDMVPMPDGRMLILSGDRAARIYDEKSVGYGFHILEASTNRLLPVELDPLPFDFHPTNIGVWHDPATGSIWVFVVNYRQSRSYVERFRLVDQRLQFEDSQTNELILYPRTIIPLGADTFLLLNEFGLFTPAGHFIEDLFGLKRSYIARCDPSGCVRVVDNLAHGISMALDDGGRMAVATHGDNALQLYSKSGDDWQLVAKQSVDSTVDQVSLLGQGEFLLTSHPDGVELRSHVMDPRYVTAPSEIHAFHAVGTVPSMSLESRQLWLSLGGDVLSAAKYALRSGSWLYLGAPHSNHLAACRVPIQEGSTP